MKAIFEIIKTLSIYIYVMLIHPLWYMMLYPWRNKLNISINKMFSNMINTGKIKIVTNKQEIIKKGYCLVNHRSWFDCVHDMALCKASITSRFLAVIPMLTLFFKMKLDNRLVIVNRKNDSRHEMFIKLKNHLKEQDRIIFYPEGTRNKYLSLQDENELEKYLKFGLLKSIYEDSEYPVQIFVSKGKEDIFNEKTLQVKLGGRVKTEISPGIYPQDFKTFESFKKKIIKTWFNLHYKLYSNS